MAAGSGGKQLTVTLSGGLGINDIVVDARYSRIWRLSPIMNVAEEFYLVAEVQGYHSGRSSDTSVRN